MVVSLLESEEAREAGLEQEAKICQENGLRFHSFPIRDRDVPSSESSALEFIEKLNVAAGAGDCINIHCRQGIGRAGLLATAMLIRAGIEVQEAIRRVSSARGLPVPETADQVSWLEKLAEKP